MPTKEQISAKKTKGTPPTIDVKTWQNNFPDQTVEQIADEQKALENKLALHRLKKTHSL